MQLDFPPPLIILTVNRPKVLLASVLTDMVIDKAEKAVTGWFVIQKNGLFGSSAIRNPFKIIRLQQHVWS